jgi:hypothetical protein
MGTTEQQQVPGINRIDLQEHDLSVPGREVVQNRVELSPEAPPLKHFHYGEEVIYVLEGHDQARDRGTGDEDSVRRRGPHRPGPSRPLRHGRR